jgi:adenine-specific DNA-methyltransferase
MANEQEKMDLGAEVEATSVDGYKFQPIKGYPMLNWRGKRPFTSTQFYPAQLKETYGEEVDGWRNKIFWGDNLQVMSHLLKEFRGEVDLIYIDPPFDSKADYKKKIKKRGYSGAIGDQNVFEEKQYTDMWNNDEFLQFLYERLVLLKELLSKDGTIFVHCDWHKAHHIRCMLDEIFGVENFINECVWKRTTAHGDAKQGAKRFDIVHDNVLIYAAGTNFKWNTQYIPFGKDQVAQQYNKTDEDGRRYRLVTPTASKPGGDTSYEFMGVRPPEGRFWAYKKETLEKYSQEGKLYFSSSGQPYLKYFLDERPGVAASTIWSDIGLLAPTSNERVHYPTQKPEALLERVIKTGTNEGDLVLDMFMGSGTTQSVAAKLNRRFIGADVNLGAVQTTTKRLIGILEATPELGSPQKSGFDVYNVNNYDVFRNPAEAKALLADALEIQKIETSSIYDGEKDGRMVKIMPVNRIATKADLSELIAGFDYKAFDRRQNANPNQPVEKILLVCMGHEPDLKAQLELEVKPHKIDVEVVDILRDKSQLEFKRDSEARLAIKDGYLEVERFYPMNLLQKLSLQKEQVTDWREMVESIMVDWNYDGAILQPVELDVPEKNELVSGRYKVPEDAGTVRVKITDLLSESWEGSIDG